VKRRARKAVSTVFGLNPPSHSLKGEGGYGQPAREGIAAARRRFQSREMSLLYKNKLSNPHKAL